jgi:tetratricopeptide (TPR) repeat protein
VLKKRLAVFFMFILVSVLFADNTMPQKLLDLQNKLERVNGKEKVDLLNDISKNYSYIDSKKMIEFGNQALELAKKINYEIGEVDSLNRICRGYLFMRKYNKALSFGKKGLKFAEKIKYKKGTANLLSSIGSVFYYLYDYDQALSYYFKSLKIREEMGDKSGIAGSLNNIAIVYQDMYNLDKALQYYLRTLEIEKEIGDQSEITLTLNNIGSIYTDLGNYNQSLEYYFQSLQIHEKYGTSTGIAYSLNNVGIVYYSLGNYEQALVYFLKSLKIHEESGDKKQIAMVLQNIGKVYSELKNFKKALSIYLRSLKIAEGIGDKGVIADSLNSIGATYSEFNDYNQALTYYLRAIKIREEIKDKAGVGACFNNIGVIYSKLKNFKHALSYYLKSVEIGKEIGNKSGIANSLNNIGSTCIQLKEYAKAKDYLDQGLKLAKEISAKDLVNSSYEVFYELYKATGDYKKALEYYELYFKTDKEIYNDMSSKSIAEMQEKYASEKKEKENIKLRNEKLIWEKDKKIQQLIQKGLIIIVCLVIIITGLLFNKFVYLLTFWKEKKYIGQFRLQEKIGTGGMGTVYKAHNIKNKKDIAAVKILKEDLFANEIERKRFDREGDVIEKLDHPHIVKIRERGLYKDSMYLVMEYIKGETLAKKITDTGRLAPEVCFNIMMQITAAISYIHSKSIIHRDLKTANIILIEKSDNPYFVKLLDFGIAKTEGSTTITINGGFLGTPSYMSPEQILTPSEITMKSDVFSLGLLFYEMLTGINPFTGSTHQESISNILEKIPPEPKRIHPDISDELNQLIMDMLDKDFLKRPELEDILVCLKKLSDCHTQNEEIHS